MMRSSIMVAAQQLSPLGTKLLPASAGWGGATRLITLGDRPVPEGVAQERERSGWVERVTDKS